MDEWDANYYAQPVAPRQILIDRTVANPGADTLRKEVAVVGGDGKKFRRLWSWRSSKCNKLKL